MTNLVNHHHFTFSCADETLAATIDYTGDTLPQPTILCLHGGGLGGRQKIEWLSLYLASRGHAVLRFDHSGVGDSTGDLKQSNMHKRRDEALVASTFLKPDTVYTLIGTSMGGPNAVALLPYLNVENLILFCPAAYAAASFDVPFGSGFTDIIRQPDSFRDATTFQHLESFTGNLLLFVGSHDEIIPPEVIALYDRHSTRCRTKTFVTVPNAPHKLYEWLPQHPDEQQHVFDAVLDLINPSA